MGPVRQTRFQHEEGVARLLAAASRENDERRQHGRLPLFMQVTLLVPRRGTSVRYACYLRDVSASGIGLMHHFPVTRGSIDVLVHLPQAEQIYLTGEIVWCRPSRDGWFLSGVRFLPDATQSPRQTSTDETVEQTF